MTAQPCPDLRARFLGGMAHAASTVNIVTTDGPAGRAGVTVSAMTSVSADTPRPTLLVCVHHLSPAAPKIIANGCFCVNVLRDDQTHISDAFAGRFKDRLVDKFDCTGWVTGATGAPRVAEPLAAFDCRVAGAEQIGTHHVFIGEVEDIFAARAGSPLIYANRAYGRPARIEPVTAPGAAGAVEPAPLRLGCFHTFGPHVLPGLLARMDRGGMAMTLVEGDHARVLDGLRAGETDLALVYDFDLGPDLLTEDLGTLAPYALLAADHPLAARPALSLADLAGEPMVLLDAPPSGAYFLSLFEAAGHSPEIRYRSGSFEMVRGLVGQGLGFALLATRPAADRSYDGAALAARPLTDDLPPSRLVLAARKDGPCHPAAERFIWLCHEMFEHEI